MAHQQADQPERGQGGALPDEQAEMAAAGSLGREGDQAAERGVGDQGPAAVGEPWREARLGEEGVGIGAEFDEDRVDRLRELGMDEADRRGRLG